jgi:uncharacterized membrane protein YebE (DUF533 family)
MDMIDILGGILGEKAGKSGRGSDVLKDMFGRSARRGSTSKIPTEAEIEQQARELEDMLSVAKDRHDRYQTPSSERSQPAPRQSSPAQPEPSEPSSKASGERALILIRAMVNAAKADGQIDAEEQKKILSRLSDRSQETIDFLREEFARPVKVGEFARSVPLGMEQQVYMLSLITMDLNTSDEAQYLTELSDALRISPEVRNQIHDRVGAPSIY